MGSKFHNLARPLKSSGCLTIPSRTPSFSLRSEPAFVTTNPQSYCGGIIHLHRNTPTVSNASDQGLEPLQLSGLRENRTNPDGQGLRLDFARGAVGYRFHSGGARNHLLVKAARIKRT